MFRSIGIMPYITKGYSDEELKKIETEIKEILKLLKQDPDQIALYGSNVGEFDLCGKEIPLLIIARSGREPSFEIFPTTQNGEIITIFNKIDSL